MSIGTRRPDRIRPAEVPGRGTATTGHDRARDTGAEPASLVPEIEARVGAVLDPLAARCRGWRAEGIGPLVARTWQGRFGGELNPTAVAATAAALADGRHWSRVLWGGGR